MRFVISLLCMLVTVSAASADIFMTSLNYPGVYGKYNLGHAPTESYGIGPNGSSASRKPIKKFVTITVLLPKPDAKLWINGTFVMGWGYARQFYTEDLTPGAVYDYRFETTWAGNRYSTIVPLSFTSDRVFVNCDDDPVRQLDRIKRDRCDTNCR